MTKKSDLGIVLDSIKANDKRLEIIANYIHDGFFTCCDVCPPPSEELTSRLSLEMHSYEWYIMGFLEDLSMKMGENM